MVVAGPEGWYALLFNTANATTLVRGGGNSRDSIAVEIAHLDSRNRVMYIHLVGKDQQRYVSIHHIFRTKTMETIHTQLHR